MRDYEKLCELLRDEFSPCPQECEYYSPGGCEAESCPYVYKVTGKDLDHDAADAIEELLDEVKRLKSKINIDKIDKYRPDCGAKMGGRGNE